MCNGKGWDIAFYSDDDDNEITVQQHFCRILDDCGHVDNTLEEAAREVAKYYRERADWYKKEHRDTEYFKTDTYAHYLRQSALWENFSHPSYLYYKQESLEGDPL